MSYDAASRLVGQLYPTGRLNTYTYDAAGHRTVMADATGLTTSTFDPLYRTSLVANPAGKTVSYTYDLADRRRTMTSPAGGLFTYTFDPAGNLTQVTNPQGKATTTTYDPLNRPALKQMANGAAVSQTWDAAGRLTTLANFGSGGGLVNCFTYTYDAADNRLTMTEALGSQTVWTYDPTRQLLAETRTAGIATIAWVPLSGPQWQGLSLNDWSAMLLDTDYPRVVYCTTYTYDPAGNRILQNDSGQLTTYTYDDTNQLLTLQNPAGVTTYTSDADGNRTQQNAPSSVTYYSWDEDDRLIEAEPVAGVVAFTYNADGQRMVKTAPASTTRFIYDFQRLLEETDGSGATENQYTYVNNGFGDLVSEYDTSDTTYHAYDAQHSTDSLLDDSGSTIDVYKYKAFGLAQAQIGVSQTPFTYVGQQGYYQDAELELYYLGMGGGPPAGRAYDPSTGRFLTPDPTGFTAGDANLYRCVGNNPVGASDPDAHQTIIAEPPPAEAPPLPASAAGTGAASGPQGAIVTPGQGPYADVPADDNSGEARWMRNIRINERKEEYERGDRRLRDAVDDARKRGASEVKIKRILSTLKNGSVTAAGDASDPLDDAIDELKRLRSSSRKLDEKPRGEGAAIMSREPRGSGQGNPPRPPKLPPAQGGQDDSDDEENDGRRNWKGLPLRESAAGKDEPEAGTFVRRIPLSKNTPDGIYKFVVDEYGDIWLARVSEDVPHSALVPRGALVYGAGYCAIRNGTANVNGRSGHYMAENPLRAYPRTFAVLNATIAN